MGSDFLRKTAAFPEVFPKYFNSSSGMKLAISRFKRRGEI
jgi:hypothetical protein